MLARPILSPIVPSSLLLLLSACPPGDGGTDSDPTTGATTTMPATDSASSTGGSATSGQPTSGTTGDTTTTGAPGGPYAPCFDPSECEPDLHCVQIYNYCSPNCEMDPDCPLPASGDSAPSCTDSSHGSFCRLPCGGLQICPDAMICVNQQPGPPASCGYPFP